MTFILSDESINDRGFRILTSGIDLGTFKKNPVMLWMHQRDDGFFSEKLPIGKWDNIRVEDNKLLADPVFDEKDEFALKIKSKVEQDFIRSASVGVDILAVSEEEKHIEKGQTRPTVTKCKIFEASIVDIPSNSNAMKLRLYSASKEVELPLLKTQHTMDEKEKLQNENWLKSVLKETFGLKTKEEQKAEEEKTQLAGLQDKLTTVEGEKETLSTENGSLKNEIETLKAKVAELEKKPGEEHSETTKETDAGESSGDSDILSKEDIELFNKVKI